MRHHRRLAATLSVLMAVTLASVAVPPQAAAAAAGPSTPLEQTASVPVTRQSMTARDPDEASLAALNGNQPAGGSPAAGAGTPTATPLTPSATWRVAEHTGDFAWSYPLRVPPAPGGLEPSLSLNYSSSSVDGRTSATNNQPSWVGDGWNLSVGFIDRVYLPCKQRADLCWRSDNAVAAFGAGGQLIKEAGDNRLWRMESDDGSRIERFDGIGNGDDNGEYWRITTVDGTQYFFGSRPEAHSTWTVPVFGDDAGEPCHGTYCQQAWRWNLDKVVDTHGNTILYGYDTETNSYGLDGGDTAVGYTRGGNLRTAEYGPVVGGKRTGRVDFLTGNRCVPGSECVESRKENWPDVAWKYKCDTATCPDRHAPSFWTTKRLEKITTSVLKAGAYQQVDSWTLEHAFPHPGTDETAALWLRAVTHTGHVNGEISLPSVTFEGRRLPNRVPLPEVFSPINRFRISAIVSESGGVIDVTYRPADCTPNSLPGEAHTNTRLCYPVKWTPPGSVAERTDYFHKYVVDTVKQLDRLGSGFPQTTRYEYLDGAAWHYDTSEFTEDNRRTWNEFRGFGRVRVIGGDTDDPAGAAKTMSELRFYRGMHDDTLPNGAKRSVTVDGRPDYDWLAGFGYYTATHLGTAGDVVTKIVTTPGWQGPTATRGAIKAYLVRPESKHSFTALSSGGWREAQVNVSYDDRGLTTAVSDLGDLGTTDDDQCATTTYTRNPTAWILDKASKTQTTIGACGTPNPVLLSASQTAYDQQAFGAAPVTGNATETKAAKDTGPSYQPQTATEFDTFGRPVRTTDPLGRETLVSYSPPGEPTSQVVTTNALGHKVTTTFDPAWGLAIKTVDASNLATETSYDALGRLTEAWLPNRPRSLNPRGNVRYAYTVRSDAPTYVKTEKVGPNGNPATSYTLYDGLLRQRQTQAPAAGGGRLVTSVHYDTQGRVYKSSGPFFNDSPPDGSLVAALDNTLPVVNHTFYDAAGRVSAAEVRIPNQPVKRTVTTYGGDRVQVVPPPGEPTTVKVFDARGKVTELLQSGQKTSYAYTSAGELASITDPAGNVWRYDYDLLGNRKQSRDVDKGVSTATFDAAGQLVTSTDARGTKLEYDYDKLGRQTALRQGTTVLAEWTYDTAANGVGLPAKTTRYVDGKAYVTWIRGYSALKSITRTETIVPDNEQTLAGSYVTSYSYNADGSLRAEALPAIGELKAETVTHTYDDSGRALRTWGAYNSTTVEYVLNTEYTRYGEAHRLHLGEGAKRAWITTYRELGTRWLDRTVVDAEAPSPRQSDTSYDYDPSGNITSIVNETPGEPVDRQCFQHDEQRRLKAAWTPTGDCAQAPQLSTLGGPAPYWQTFGYDLAGNRVSDTRFDTGVTRDYRYPAGGHRLASVTAGSKVDSFGYDLSGNATSWAGQTMAWDEEGRLRQAGTTTFIPAADGTRLLRKEPNAATLYLPGQELRMDTTTGARTAVRYYTHDGQNIAVRGGGKTTWIAADHQNTAQVSIDADSLQVSRRRFGPFGEERGSVQAFVGDRSFVEGIRNPATALVTLGAREYDASLGRFTSVDPLLNVADPQQLNAYGYADNSPVTYSDPSGLIMCPDGDCRNGKGPAGKSPADIVAQQRQEALALAQAVRAVAQRLAQALRAQAEVRRQAEALRILLVLKKALVPKREQVPSASSEQAMQRIAAALDEPDKDIRIECKENTSLFYVLLGGAITCTRAEKQNDTWKFSRETTTSGGGKRTQKWTIDSSGDIIDRTECSGAGTDKRCSHWSSDGKTSMYAASQDCQEEANELILTGVGTIGAIGSAFAAPLFGGIAAAGGVGMYGNSIMKVNRQCTPGGSK